MISREHYNGVELFLGELLGGPDREAEEATPGLAREHPHRLEPQLLERQVGQLRGLSGAV